MKFLISMMEKQDTVLTDIVYTVYDGINAIY